MNVSSQAVAVLKEFYAKAATATALVQQPEVALSLGRDSGRKLAQGSGAVRLD